MLQCLTLIGFLNYSSSKKMLYFTPYILFVLCYTNFVFCSCIIEYQYNINHVLKKRFKSSSNFKGLKIKINGEIKLSSDFLYSLWHNLKNFDFVNFFAIVLITINKIVNLSTTTTDGFTHNKMF